MTAGDSTTGSTSLDPDFAPIVLESVRVRNFRGIADCLLHLEPRMTLLVGQNNAGKSRLLRAIALGLGGATPDRDDLTVGGEQPATIDLVIAPAVRSEEQDFTDRVARKLGRDIQPISDDPLRERFGWRTSISPSKEGYGVRSTSEIMTYDSISGEWTVRANAPSLNNEQRSLISADLVDTRRDLVEEFSRRGSAIRRVLDDLEISPSARLALESDLNALGTRIVDESGALAALRTALSSATDLVGGLGEPSVEPLPVRLEELARSVSINLGSRQGSLPLRFHGAGARSLASLQVQGVLYDRRIGRDGSALRPHAVSLVEEPESHLHPQAQLELPALLERIQGQVVVSTHSSHLATAADPLSVRILRETDHRLHVVDLHPSPTAESELPRLRQPQLFADEIEKLKRQVERPFGELLFASAVVLGDGATERALLPPLLRRSLGSRAHGVCVVDPGSLGQPLAIAIVKFANLVGVPWLLFCDSDAKGKEAADRIVADHGQVGGEHVVWTADPGGGGAVEQMLLEHDQRLCRDVCVNLGFNGRDDELLGFMCGRKGSLGSHIALELLTVQGPRHNGRHPWPSPICDLIDRLDAVLPGRGEN